MNFTVMAMHGTDKEEGQWSVMLEHEQRFHGLVRVDCVVCEALHIRELSGRVWQPRGRLSTASSAIKRQVYWMVTPVSGCKEQGLVMLIVIQYTHRLQLCSQPLRFTTGHPSAPQSPQLFSNHDPWQDLQEKFTLP